MKNILLTGISGGLGLNLTKLLLENNYNVYGVSRKMNYELGELLNQYKDRLKIKLFDLEATEKVKDEIFKDFILDAPLFGFINNAAIAYDDIITNANYSELKKMYHVNVFTPLILTKYFIRNLILNSSSGTIVHVSSISVHTGYKGLSMYASTKAAIEAFSKNTAREWGEKSVRSNCVVAGFMDTNMSSGLSNGQKERIYKRNSLKKPTEINSVAETILFLLSEKSESITGQNIFVDSGTI